LLGPLPNANPKLLDFAVLGIAIVPREFNTVAFFAFLGGAEVFSAGFPPKKENDGFGAGVGAGAGAGAAFFGAGLLKNEKGFGAGGDTGSGAGFGAGGGLPKNEKAGFGAGFNCGTGSGLVFGLGLAPPKNEKGSFLDVGTGVTAGAGLGATFGVGAVLRLPKKEEKASVIGTETLTSLTSLGFGVEITGFFTAGFLATTGLEFGTETTGFFAAGFLAVGFSAVALKMEPRSIFGDSFFGVGVDD
jgi:hypothetical protein